MRKTRRGAQPRTSQVVHVLRLNNLYNILVRFPGERAEDYQAQTE